jgi:excisionase family DNA binding protein
MNDNDELLSATAAAELIGVSSTTLARAVRLGNLPAIRVGSTYVIKRSDAEAWLKEHFHPHMVRPRQHWRAGK